MSLDLPVLEAFSSTKMLTPSPVFPDYVSHMELVSQVGDGRGPLYPNKIEVRLTVEWVDGKEYQIDVPIDSSSMNSSQGVTGEVLGRAVKNFRSSFVPIYPLTGSIRVLGYNFQSAQDILTERIDFLKRKGQKNFPFLKILASHYEMRGVPQSDLLLVGGWYMRDDLDDFALELYRFNRGRAFDMHGQIKELSPNVKPRS